MACLQWKDITDKKRKEIIARRDIFPEDWTIKDDRTYFSLNYCPFCNFKINEYSCTNPNNELIDTIINIIDELKTNNYITILNSEEMLRKFKNITKVLEKHEYKEEIL